MKIIEYIIIHVVIVSVQNFVKIKGYPKDNVEEVFKWKKIVFENLPKSENSMVGPYRYYIPENCNIASMGYHPASGLMIVGFLRTRPGNPVTLGAFCVDKYKYGSSPKIWGFPNYAMNDFQSSDFTENSNEGRRGSIAHQYVHYVPNYEHTSVDVGKPKGPIRIISVLHITIDERCNRVFFMDNGQMNYYRNTTYVIQKPALVVIELPSNGCESRNFPIIRRSELPNKISTMGANGFMHVILDYQSSDSCDDLFLYISNTFFYFLVVYDYKKDKFWTFKHETFEPITAESYLVFDTLNYQMQMGILSIALGYPDVNGDQTAYYTPLSGTAQYAVSTKILKNSRKSPENFKPDDFRIMGHRGTGHQSLKTVIDYTYGVMFYSEAQSNQIRCWNISKSLNLDNIGIVYDSEKFNFGSQMFIDSRGYLWFQYNVIPIMYATDNPLDFTRINNRIFRVKVSDAIRGTVCENP